MCPLSQPLWPMLPPRWSSPFSPNYPLLSAGSEWHVRAAVISILPAAGLWSSSLCLSQHLIFLSADDLLLKYDHFTFDSVSSTGYFSVTVLPVASKEVFTLPCLSALVNNKLLHILWLFHCTEAQHPFCCLKIMNTSYVQKTCKPLMQKAVLAERHFLGRNSSSLDSGDTDSDDWKCASSSVNNTVSTS